MSREKQFEVRDLRKGDWVWSDKRVLFSPHINGNDFKVYAGLSSYAGNEDQKSWPSFETMASTLNMGRSTVIRSIKNLEALKLVRVERREGSSNLYYLLDIPALIEKQGRTKKKSPHHRFIEFFYEAAQRTRGFKPKFTAKDTAHLKRVLDAGTLTEEEMEQIALYFLYKSEFTKFTPSLSTLFSNGILTSLINTLKNDKRTFWATLEEAQVKMRDVNLASRVKTGEGRSLSEQLETLRKKLSV